MAKANFDFTGKNVLVTGAASGIGLAIASAFSKAGAQVFACDIDAQALEDAREVLGPSTETHTWDAGCSNAIESAAQQLQSRGIALHTVVNNAGVARLESIASLSDEAMNMQWRVLLKGPMVCIKHFAPLMPGDRHASFINIASIAAIIQATDHAVYCACKAGLAKLTQSAVKEYPALRFNTILPGFIDTPILEVYSEGEALRDLKTDIARRAPAARLGCADDIAEAALFLASDSASYVNGSSVVVDGGITAACNLEFL